MRPRLLPDFLLLSTAVLLTTSIALSQVPTGTPVDPLLTEFAAKMAAGDLRVARALAEAASAAEPGSWRARVLQGYVLLALDQRVEAEARLQEGLRNYDAAAKVRAAEASGAAPVAVEVPAPAKLPEAPVVDASVEAVASEQLQRDDPEKAAGLLARAFEAHPERTEYAFQAARLFQATRREWRAWAIYHRLRTHEDPRVMKRATDAQQALGVGNAPEERSAAAVNRKLGLGLTHLSKGNPKDAADCFLGAVDEDPSNSALSEIAGGLFEEARPERESVRLWLQLLARATSAARDKIAAHLVARGEELRRKGDELVNLGKLLEAIQLYEAAVETGPNQLGAHLQLARCYEQIGKYEVAARHRRMVAASGDPDLAPEAQRSIDEARRGAARAEQVEGTDPGAAAAAYASGFAADPSLFAYGYRAAKLFSTLDQTAKVVALCRQLVNAPQYGAEARRMLAGIRQQAAKRLASKGDEVKRLITAKDVEAAIQVLSSVFEGIDDPRYEAAKELLESGDVSKAGIALDSAIAMLRDGVDGSVPNVGMQPIQEGANFMPSSGVRLLWVDADTASGAEASEGGSASKSGFWISEASVSAEQWVGFVGKVRNAPRGAHEGVSWPQAEAYCSLLTSVERAAGLIPKDYSYRLPDLAMCKRAHAAHKLPKDLRIWLSTIGSYYRPETSTAVDLGSAQYHYGLHLRPVLVREVPGGRH